MTGSVDLALLRSTLSHLEKLCRRHQLPPGRCRCQGCPLEDACAEYLDDCDSLAEFCRDAIRDIYAEEVMG